MYENLIIDDIAMMVIIYRWHCDEGFLQFIFWLGIKHNLNKMKKAQVLTTFSNEEIFNVKFYGKGGLPYDNFNWIIFLSSPDAIGDIAYVMHKIKEGKITEVIDLTRVI